MFCIAKSEYVDPYIIAHLYHETIMAVWPVRARVPDNVTMPLATGFVNPIIMNTQY